MSVDSMVLKKCERRTNQVVGRRLSSVKRQPSAPGEVLLCFLASVARRSSEVRGW